MGCPSLCIFSRYAGRICNPGLFHTFMGIPAILAGILTQLGLYSVNLKIMGKSNQAINVDKFDLMVSLRYIKNVAIYKNTILIVAVLIILLDSSNCTGSLVQNLDVPYVQPDVMTRWQEHRESTRILTGYLAL